MFDYCLLSQEDKEKVYKYIRQTDIAKGLPKKKALVYFKKSNDKVTKKEFFNKLEESYPSNIDFCALASAIFKKKISDGYSSIHKVMKLINDKTYTEVLEEYKSEVEVYREEWNNSKMPISFDSFLKASCKLTEAEEEAICTKLMEDKYNDLIEQYNEKCSDYKELKDKYDAEIKIFSKEKNLYENEIRILKKEKNDLITKSEEGKKSSSITFEKIRFNLSSLLDIKGVTNYSQLYNKLDVLEKSCINTSDYTKIYKIISAKYAVMKMMEEENEQGN